MTALITASNTGHDRIVDMLLRRGAAVDLQNSIGRSALMIASFCGHERIVDMLLQRGAAHWNERSLDIMFTVVLQL